jgi:hypothetical protein
VAPQRAKQATPAAGDNGTAKAGKAGAKAGAKSAAPAEKEKGRLRRRMREAPAKLIGRTPWLRKRYARFMLKSIAKRRKKGKPMPDELLMLERQLRGMAPAQQAKVLEQALEQGAASPEASNRATRRAAQRPSRQSGRGQGRRPGLPPGTPRPRPPR